MQGLEAAKIKKFVPAGEKFDPNLHAAVFEIPAGERGREGRLRRSRVGDGGCETDQGLGGEFGLGCRRDLEDAVRR